MRRSGSRRASSGTCRRSTTAPGQGGAGGRRPGPGRRIGPGQPVPDADLRPHPAARRPGAAGGPAGRRAADRGARSSRSGVVIRPFTYQALPMRVVFGAGALANLPDEVAALGLTRVVVLCPPEQEVTGKQVAAALGERAAGVLPEARMHVPVEVAR